MSNIPGGNPQQRDYQLDDELPVDTATRLKALGDPLRLLICDLVLERAMSVTELAAAVDRPKGTVAYHTNLLVDAGLLKVVRTRQVRAVEERFYGRTARTYVLPRQPGEIPFLRELVADIDLDTTDATELLGNSPFTYRRARIPAARASEYLRRLHSLAVEFVDEPRDGTDEFGLYVGVFPTRRHPTTSGGNS